MKPALEVGLVGNKTRDYYPAVIVTATELANDSKRVLDRVIEGGEVIEVQKQGRTVAEIRPRVGVNRLELLTLLEGRGFSNSDTRELQTAMDSSSQVVGYAGGD